MKKYLFMVILAWMLTIQTNSQTIINAGPVSGTWTAAGSPYHIMGDIEVPTGEVLVIEPEVTVKIFSELSFEVYGKLLAEGTVIDSIFFVPVAAYWKGLRILNTSDTCSFNYCKFINFKNSKPYQSDKYKGGTIYAINSKLVIDNSLFYNNAIELNISGDAYGGAVCLENCSGSIINSTFTQNSISVLIESASCQAWTEGGAIWSSGGNVHIKNNLINFNSISVICISTGYSGSGSALASGGGISIYDGGFVENNNIQNNICYSYATAIGDEGMADAYSGGGGITSFYIILKNNLITENLCESYANVQGGAPPIMESACSQGGGVDGGILVNNTIVSNSIYAYSIGSCTNGSGINSGTISNCIVWNNIGDELQASLIQMEYSCIQGLFYPGPGNIGDDPLFVNSSLGDYHLKQPPCQTELSPCVDAGDPNIALFPGTTRTDNYPDVGIIDMGYHYPLSDSLFANFQVDKNCGLSPISVNYSNESYLLLMDTVSYAWDFDNDGNIDSNEENPDWTYDEIGNYSVKLIVTGADFLGGLHIDTLLRINYINVFYLEAGFEEDTVFGSSPLIVQFNDTSYYVNTQIGQRQWDFENDGITDSEEENPTWTYDVPGLFSVKLIVTDSCGSTNDTLIKEDLINVNGIMAGFDAFPVFGYIPLSVNFFNTSLSHNAEITGWEWDFHNDGTTDSFEENPIWTYSEAGFYSVKLIITGQTAKELVTDTILKINFITANELVAEFHPDKNYGHFPLQVHFYDDSYSYPINYGQINSWNWDFQNDGTIDSYIQNPVWTYSQPGIYSVKFIAGNSNYMTYDTILKADCIKVCSMVPGFYAEPLSGDVPLEVNFLDTSFIENTQVSTWKWDFQHDGLIDAYGPNPTWTYPETGMYSVELRITDTSGQIWKSVVKEDYIQVNSVTGIPYRLEENVQNKLKIYPNPFTSDLIIEFEFDKPDVVTVQIFDVAFKPVASIAEDEKITVGKKFWKWESRDNKTSSGIYYISMTSSSKKQYIEKCIRVD